MLLEFSCKHYKTFREEAIFSMVPRARSNNLSYSILSEKAGSKNYRALPSSIIYGPNASGKTNLIEAMDVFRNIVSRGNIMDDSGPIQGNPVVNNMSVIPSIKQEQAEPVEFRIAFITEKTHISYSLSLSIGRFMETGFPRQVHQEHLAVNGKTVFDRVSNHVEKVVLTHQQSGAKRPGKRATTENPDYVALLLKKANDNLSSTDLFLTSGFKSIFSLKISELVTHWISQSFKTFPNSQRMSTCPPRPLEQKQVVYYPKEIQDAMAEFGTNHNQIVFVQHQEGQPPQKMSVIVIEGKKMLIPVSQFESLGTIRFLDIMPFLCDAIKQGQTLVFDEFDASFHPMALMSIIKVFHNDEINRNGAQLIFNSHNPIFLNPSLFRRDEIKFVDRDKETGDSELYQLSDFKTNSDVSARNTSSYMKNYFIHRYGAIDDIDFSDMFISAAQQDEIDSSNETIKEEEENHHD